jgi:hypothetical protein
MTVDFDYDQITLDKWSADGPTCFDSASNYGGEDMSEFYVASCSVNRDTQCVLTLCNWKLMCDKLDEFVKHEESGITRFGHWANGWYELYLIHESDTDALVKAQEIADDLEQYPVLDEDKYSEMEYQAQCEEWERYYCDEFRKILINKVDEEFCFDTRQDEEIEEISKVMKKRHNKEYDFNNFYDRDEVIEDAIYLLAQAKGIDEDEYLYSIFRSLDPEWCDGNEGVYVANASCLKDKISVETIREIINVFTRIENKDQLVLPIAS